MWLWFDKSFEQHYQNMLVASAAMTLLRDGGGGVEEGLEHKIDFFLFQEISFLGRVQSKVMQLKGIIEEVLETEPPVGENHWGLGKSLQSLGDFCNFLKKIAYLTPL